MMDSQRNSFPLLNPNSPRSSARSLTATKRQSIHNKPSQYQQQQSIQSQKQIQTKNQKITSLEDAQSPPNSNTRIYQISQLDELKLNIQMNNTIDQSQNQNQISHHMQFEESRDILHSPLGSPSGSLNRIPMQYGHRRHSRIEYYNGLNSPIMSPFQRIGSQKAVYIKNLSLQNEDKKNQKNQNDGCDTPLPQKDQKEDKLTNLLKYIQIKPLISRVVHKLESRRKRLLKSNHLFFLNDLSIINSSSQNQEKKQKCVIIIEYIMSIFSQILALIRFPIINPASYYKIAWDILNLFSIFIMIFLIPIVLSFQISINHLSNKWCMQVIQIITFADIIISFNTAYYQKGIVVEDRLKIALNYLGNQFIIDIISFANIIILSNTDQFRYYYVFSLIYLFKMTIVSSLSKKLEEAFNFSSYTSHLFQLLRLLLTVLLISHLFASLWIFIVNFQKTMDPSTITWLDNKKLTNEIWSVKYLTAIYFCTVTMVTVGYGDITPYTKIEYVFSIFTILIACGVFGYSVNFLGKIFQSLQEQQNYIKKNMGIINQYMQKKKISNTLKYQVREYLEYIWKESLSGQTTAENRIINSLSESLQQDLLYEANKIVLDDFPLFKKNFSPQCLAKIVPLIVENRLIPEEFIFTKDEEDDCSIFFIESGQVEICMFNKQKNKVTKRITTLKEGQCFGFQSFLTGERRTMSIRSLDFTQLLQIKRKDFLDMLESFEEDYERFCVLKDSVMNENNQSILNLPCLCCGQKDHVVNKCIYIHYTPNHLKQQITIVNSQIQFFISYRHFQNISIQKFYLIDEMFTVFNFYLKKIRISGIYCQNFDQKRQPHKRTFLKTATLAQFNENYESMIRFHNENYEDILNYIDEFDIFQDDIDDIISQLSQQQIERLGYNFERIIEYSSQDEASNLSDSSLNSQELNRMQSFKIQLQKMNDLTNLTTLCDIPDDPPNQKLNSLPHETKQMKSLEFQSQQRRYRQNIRNATIIRQKQLKQNLMIDLSKDKELKKKFSRQWVQEEAQSPLSPYQQKNKKSQLKRYDSKVISPSSRVNKNQQETIEKLSSFESANRDSFRVQNFPHKIPYDNKFIRSNSKILQINTSQTSGISKLDDKKLLNPISENQNKKGLHTPSIRLISDYPQSFFENLNSSQQLSRDSIKRIQIQVAELDQNNNNSNNQNNNNNNQEISQDKSQKFEESQAMDLFFYDFEAQKNYKKYFYKYNMNEVVERCKNKQEKNERIKKRKIMNHLQKNIKTMLRQQQQQQQQIQQHPQQQLLGIGQSQLMRRRETQHSSSSNDLMNSNNNNYMYYKDDSLKEI